MGIKIFNDDARNVANLLPPESVQCVVTSPPYFSLRDYGVDGQIGIEETPEQFVSELIKVFRGIRDVLRPDGTVWINLGDSYARSGGTDRRPPRKARVGNTRRTMDLIADRTSTPPKGLKPKDLLGIPWRIAFALQADGWYLRSDIIWEKTNAQPESVRDRPTRSHEYIFLLSKSEKYYYDIDAIKEPAASGMGATRNRRTVWTFPTQPFPGAHFATFPERLPELCILAGSRPGDVVLDPFMGSGTTLRVAKLLGRVGVGVELNPQFIEVAKRRLSGMHTT